MEATIVQNAVDKHVEKHNRKLTDKMIVEVEGSVLSTKSKRNFTILSVRIKIVFTL